jgi:hypothetical protein
MSGLAGATDESTREIWDTRYRNQRPAASHRPIDAPPAKLVEYRYSSTVAGSVAATGSPPRSAVPVIGVTLWKLRRAERGETAPRLLIPESPAAGPQPYVPERIAIGEPLRAGDRIRLGIEAPREGYLYVIDRECYRDGSRGAPYLLFPLSSLNHGDNRVRPGKLIELPAQSDPVPALRVEKRDERLTGEELLLMLSPTRLPGVDIEAPERKLREEEVGAWEHQFTPATIRLDMVGPAAGWTVEEQSAGASGRLLTPEDPMPQAIYAVPVAADQPMVVRVWLEVR